MRLQAVKISNFRSLEHTDWLGIYDLTAFIGENDGGKTAATDGIKLLLDKSARPDESDFRLKVAYDGQDEQSNSIIIEGGSRV